MNAMLFILVDIHINKKILILLNSPIKKYAHIAIFIKNP